jgi:hypothetical protein
MGEYKIKIEPDISSFFGKDRWKWTILEFRDSSWYPEREPAWYPVDMSEAFPTIGYSNEGTGCKSEEIALEKAKAMLDKWCKYIHAVRRREIYVEEHTSYHDVDCPCDV